MRGLANKGVLITGATSGIGLATAHRFLEEGARVFINGRDGPRLEAALRSLEGLGSVAGAVADVRHEARTWSGSSPRPRRGWAGSRC